MVNYKKILRNPIATGIISAGLFVSPNVSANDLVQIHWPNQKSPIGSFSTKKGIETFLRGYFNEKNNPEVRFFLRDPKTNKELEELKPSNGHISVDGKINPVTYTPLEMKGDQKLEIVIGNGQKPNKKTDYFNTSKGIPSVTLMDYNSKIQEVKTPEIKGINMVKNFRNNYFKFDLNSDGKIDYLDLKKSNNKYFIKLNNEKVISLDKVRYEVLKNLRFVENSPKEAANGYLMTYGKQGEEVIKFLFNTNKYSSNKYCIKKDECSDIKFKTLEGLILGIDKIANLSQRADYINKNILEKYNSGNLDQKIATKIMKIYSSSFSDNIPRGIVALNSILGSAVYNTIMHDFLPTKEGDKVLARARGALDATNLDYLKTNGINTNNIIKIYNNTKSMYDAQLKANKNKIEEVNF